MKLIAYTPAASFDIEAIWDHSAECWGPDQADRCADEIRDCCYGLANGTMKACAVGVRAGFWQIHTSSHLIFFRDLGHQVEIVRVLGIEQDADGIRNRIAEVFLGQGRHQMDTEVDMLAVRDD